MRPALHAWERQSFQAEIACGAPAVTVVVVVVVAVHDFPFEGCCKRNALPDAR